MTVNDKNFPMAPGPVGGSTVWRGQQTAASDEWVYQLDAADIAELDAAAEATETAGVDILDITQADFTLPGIASRLAELRNDLLHGRGFGYVRGLPVER